MLDGEDLLKLNHRDRRKRAATSSCMFQDSYASMDPRMRVATILREPLAIQGIGSRRDQQQKIAEILDKVGLPAGAIERYPHEFSGGQRQRLGLARALILNPKLLVADEPVSALDVSIQAQILNLMRDLQRDLGLTYLFISHDLSVVRYLSETIGVMYLGKMVEVGPSGRGVLLPGAPVHQGPHRHRPGGRPDQGPDQGGAGRAPASCRPPSTRRPAAGSAPGARGPRSSAPSRSRRCARSAPAATSRPATSRSATRSATPPQPAAASQLAGQPGAGPPQAGPAAPGSPSRCAGGGVDVSADPQASRAKRMVRNLVTVSASSAAGSESATMPPPANSRARGPSISAQRSAMPHSPFPALSTQPTGPA